MKSQIHCLHFRIKFDWWCRKSISRCRFEPM